MDTDILGRVVAFKKAVVIVLQAVCKWFLSSLSSDSPCQLDVLGHDGDSLGVDGA